MRVLLAISVIYHITIAQQVGINVPCNKELDGLLTADPDGDERAFMSCQGVGVGTIGFWERKLCPNNMVFDFINQQCKEQKKKARKQQTLSIAILNNSCANGETCIGGSVCDLDTLRCMCPYGTTPKLDTLSCESSQPPFVSATVDGPSQYFNSLSGANGNRNNNNNNNNNNGFMPFGQTSEVPEFQPNNNFKFNNFGNNPNNQNNQNNMNSNKNDNFNWNPNFSWNSNGNNGNNNNNNKQAPMNNMNNGAGNPDFNPFQPNPNQKFVFNFNKNQGGPNGGNNNNIQNQNQNQIVPVAEVKPKVATLAIPGASCKSNEICVGGSICTLPIGICLCPGDLEARDGECVLPAASTISVQKVGIGALCSDLAECDHGSSCIMGRCTCVSPLIQHEGKCVLRQQQKVVGPGELCDNGEICGKGSVCDVMIPVCVCPVHTDLSNGECISVTAPVTQPVMTAPPTLPPVQVPVQLPVQVPVQIPVQIPVQTLPPPTRPPPPPPVQITQPPIQPTVQQIYYQTTPPPLPPVQTYPTTPATTPFIPKQIYTTPPQMPKSSVKINQMKIGGSKQAGVGVRCSLNTDCMIGAYCNGNTNPPSCQCLSTHVNIEGRCEKVIYPGQVGCRSDSQCHSAHSGTHCIDRICVCPEGQKAVDQTCVSGTSPPNKSCGFSSTNPCSNQSVCFQNLCICPDRHSHNLSTQSCDVTSPEPTECSKACYYPRVCVNHICICPDNVDCHHMKLRARRQVESCSENVELCKSRNAECINGICQCSPGLHAVEGNCVPESATSKVQSKEATCSDSMSCPVHYVCKSGRCRCETEEFDINGNCLSPLFYGAFKNINNQCTAKDRCAGGSTCKDALCQCVDGAVEITGKCKQFPGGHCSNGEMCSGGSSCYLGKCRCDPSRTLDNQRCVQTTVPIGSTCRRGQQCVNGAACRFGLCMCVSKTIAVLGRCVHEADAVPTSLRLPETNTIVGEDKKPGMPCSTEDACLGGSMCQDGVCLCGADMVLEDDMCVILRVELTTQLVQTERPSKTQKGCSSDDSCAENMICIEEQCSCLPGFKMGGQTCQQEKMSFSSRLGKVTPGSQCTSSSDCSFRTKCVDGVCRCKKGETIIDSTCRSAIHHVLPGLSCDPSNGYDCVGESICQYGVCKCKRKLVSDGQKCVPLHLALMVMPGKSCAKAEPCGGGSYCAKDGICRCPNDEVVDVNKKCVKKHSVISVFNKIKPIITTTMPTTTTTMTTTTTFDNAYIQKKIDELEKIEMEFKNTIPVEPNPPAVHRPSSSILAGHLCTQNSECPSFSFCFANACNCMAGFRATSGICEAAIAVGEPCMTSNQCFDDTECILGVCTCTGINCKDTKMAHPGEDCTSIKIVCSYNSYCSLMSGVCECPSGMATKGTRCENTFESIGKDCVTSRNCQKSSYCDNGYCVCKNGHKIADSMCFNSPPEIKSFGILPLDKNIGENTPLQNNLKNEFRSLQEVSNEGLFYTTTKWPEILSFTMIPPPPDNSQTNSMFPQVFSSFPIVYGAKTVAEEENNSTMKYKIAFPGEYCGNGEVCLGDSVCENHFCRCLQDVTAENGVCPPQVDELRVLGLQPLGREFRFSQSKKIDMRRTSSLPLENCQNGESCGNNSTCQSILGLGKICQCVENTVLWKDECMDTDESYDLVAIEEECNEDSVCLSGSECISGKCACHEDKRLILGICVIVALPETSCENGEVCINGSICGDSNCECAEGTYNDNGNCVAVLRNESEEHDLHDSDENKVSEEEPKGESGEEEEESEMRRLVRRELGSIDCSNDSECQPHFKCQEYVCVCDENTEACLASILHTQDVVPPGSGCDENRKCGNDSICFKDFCVCSYEDMPENDQCVSRDWHVGLGSQCSNVTRCREDLHCLGGVCMCKFGDLNCNPSEPVTSPPGGSCSNLRECTGGSVCREGWCICPDPSMIVNRGICIQSGPKPTLPPRTTVPQVPLPPQLPISVHVPQVTITKAQPFVTDAPQGKKIVPGGRCGPIDVCVGGSNCIEGFCLCPAGQQPSNNGRCEKFTTTPRQTTQPSTTPGTTPPPPTTSVFTSAFTIADLLSTRRQPAFIEIPTHAPLTTTVIEQAQDECTEIGLICKGNTVCRNKSCQCPDGYVLHHDGCVSPEEAARRKARGKARHEATTARVYSKPGESCTQGQTCIGGSSCSFRKLCECPQDKSEISSGQCVTPRKIEVVPGASCNANTVCTKGSTCENGLCRCQPGYIAVSGNCVALPMPTTPKMKTIAKPLESCEGGETCDGGSSCDMDTGICMCPPGQIVFNVQCMPPPTQPQVTTRITTPIRTVVTTPKPAFATDCEKDANCGENKICVSGKCKCRPGFVDNSGTCEPLEGNRGRTLKYGQACDRYQDKCINGAKCIDKICKCSPGFLLASNGWCEGFNLEKAIEMNRQAAVTAIPTKANRIIQTKKQKVVTTTATTTTTTPSPPELHRTTDAFPTPPSNIFGFPDRRTTKKVPKVAAVGSACDTIDICLGESVCINGYCQCQQNFILQKGQCISKESKHKVAKVGESCKNGEICSGGAICDYDRKRCICAAQHVAIKGICKQKSAPAFAAPGDTCSMREKCTGGSTCFEGMCTCDDHHFAEDGYCRPIEARSSKVHFVNGAGLRFSSMQVPNRQRAQPCDESVCKLPSCFCSHDGRQPPGGLRPDETPQFVVLTFDDAVNGKTFPDYKKLFENDVLKNPNGCDVKATFFISHEWTNYDAVNWLVQKNMEIASNSISHESLEHENTNRWLNEMDGQRRILAKFGGAPEEQIVGIRAPQLAMGGDNQFEMMSGAEFLWDNSMSANPGIHGEPFWPQTLDYQVAWDCHEESCPKSSFPGIWTVPLNQFYGSYMRQIDSFRRSSMIRAAVDLNNTVDELEEIIMRNFERSYTTNRAPYVLSLNADFLQLAGQNKGMKAVQKFLNRMTAQKDVYIVTIKQLIDWMKRPVPLNQIQKSKAVGCPITLSFNRNPSLSTCDKPNKCLYSTPSLSSQEHQFLTCLPCPTMYPWLENPAGAIV